MASKARTTAHSVGQLEPILKAFTLRRLQQEAGGPGKPAKSAKPRPKKRKKA